MAAAALSAAAVSTSAAAIQRLSSDGDAKTYEGLPQIKIPPSAAADAAAAIAIAIAGSSYLGAATAARLLLATYCKGSRLAGECIPQQGRQVAAIDDPCGAHLSKPWPVAAVVRFPAAERGLQYEGDLLLCGFAARHALLRELTTYTSRNKVHQSVHRCSEFTARQAQRSAPGPPGLSGGLGAFLFSSRRVRAAAHCSGVPATARVDLQQFQS